MPQVISRAGAGLGPIIRGGTYKFGGLGEPKYVTFHHTAGPRAKTDAQAKNTLRNIQRQHIGQGWGDIGYHFAIADNGHIFHCRPIGAKGAHTEKFNTSNIGIVLIGNYETSKLTRRQRSALRWLFRGGFYQLLGVPEKDLRILIHREKVSTACPGKILAEHIRHLRAQEL